MVTRMERYNNSLEDVKITKRSDKNKDLYEKVKVTEMNPEYIDINTTNVYEIGSINDVTKRRSSYQKLRSLDDVLEKERTITPLEEKPLPKEERLYNIDDILKKAKETYKDEEKKRLLNTEYNILTKLDLDKVTSNDGFSKDHYKKMVDDLYSEKEIKQDDGTEKYFIGVSTLASKAKPGLASAFKYSIDQEGAYFKQMFIVLKGLFTGNIPVNSLSGPVGIYSIVGQVRNQGLASIMSLIALLCINVGVINLLPFPAFDGGRILFLIIEKLKGSPVSPKVENTIHSIGFILLMILMVYITFNDILKLF